MDEDEKQHLLDLKDRLDSVNKILASEKLTKEERAEHEQAKANFDRRIASKAV